MGIISSSSALWLLSPVFWPWWDRALRWFLNERVGVLGDVCSRGGGEFVSAGFLWLTYDSFLLLQFSLPCAQHLLKKAAPRRKGLLMASWQAGYRWVRFSFFQIITFFAKSWTCYLSVPWSLTARPGLRGCPNKVSRWQYLLHCSFLRGQSASRSAESFQRDAKERLDCSLNSSNWWWPLGNHLYIC